MSGEAGRELRRITAHGRARDGGPATVVAIEDFDGSWTVHALGVRLSQAAMVTFAASVIHDDAPGAGARDTLRAVDWRQLR